MKDVKAFGLAIVQTLAITVVIVLLDQGLAGVGLSVGILALYTAHTKGDK